MTLKSYLIAPEGSGLQRNLEPWLIPEDAFSNLQDAYVWRGRVRKRWGYSLLGGTDLLSRLRINLGDTDGNGDISTTVPGAVFKVGQMFSIGSELFTVNATGTPATMLDTGSATLDTYDTTTGALVITGAAATTACFFYPAEPVMGLRLRENTDLSFEATVGFDTQFAYSRSGGGWVRLGSAVWSGDDADFFWTTNYRGPNPYETYLWVTNGVALDASGNNGINLLPQGSSTWTNLKAQLDSGATRFMIGAKILIGFKDRMLALNTIEGDVGSSNQFVNRVRWSQNGDPTTAATSWLDDTPGRGGYLDAPTKEKIVTVELLRDHLIVYFERSTWELVYTADTQLPFRWQQINSELGAESRFSVIGFDEVALGVGNVGIHACSGTSVVRIDEKIPDEVFQIHNGNDGVYRVYGIRDYYREMVYWTFPDQASNPTYPTKVLAYNYAMRTWGIFNDSFTCFGYLQYDSDLTWATVGERFGTWAAWNQAWDSGQAQSQFPFIIAGNQQGFTETINTDKSSNDQSLYITDMTGTNTIVAIDHNLMEGDYILISDAEGITSLNDLVVQVLAVTDADTFTVDTSFSGTYTGGGKITRVSNINVTSKQWNPGTPIGQNFRMPYIDFLLNRTDEGEVSVDYFTDFDEDSPVSTSAVSGVLLGSEVLPTYPINSLGDPATGARLWQRFFTEVQGQTVQIKMYLNDSQMRDYDIATSDFQLNATMLYVEPSGRITG